MPLSPLADRIRHTIRRDPIQWAHACHINLRPYQRQIALAIKDSIIHHRGLTYVVILPRQSGKNELQAHLFAWLLYRSAGTGGRIVSVSPTFKPQTINNMDRVARSLSSCVCSRSLWYSSKGFIYHLGKACLQFFSGSPSARVVGATADLLLSVDEAQEVDPLKFEKDFDPMTASTNATRVFWGTAWTSSTLLQQQRLLALQAQETDGIQRVFFYTAEDVRPLVPSYGLHVDRVIAERGRDHPLVRSQYYCETIDSESSMFNPTRLALIFSNNGTPLPKSEGRSPAVLAGFGEGSEVGLFSSPIFEENGGGARRAEGASRGGFEPPSAVSAARAADNIAFLIDVAGMDESKKDLASSLAHGALTNPGRDSTTLTVVSIDLSTLADLHRPSYRVLHRQSWTGANHLAVFGALKNLAGSWKPAHMVIDSTGVGEGLFALLDRAFPTRVHPVKISAQKKSELGWRFLSIIETGRFVDPAPSDAVRLQYNRCLYEILPGPGKTLRWGVPEGQRGPDGALVHDDFLLADSLVAILDDLEWSPSLPSTFVTPEFDPLQDLSHF